MARSPRELERAQALDPRNPYASATDRDIPGIYIALRNWPAAAAAYQHLRQITPENEPPNGDAKLGLAYAEFYRTGDLGAGKEILRQIPAGVDPDRSVTLSRWEFSLWERDFAAAEKVMAQHPSEEFPPPMRTPTSYYQAVTVLARGDAAVAQSMFEKVLPIFELRVQVHPDDPGSLGHLAKLYTYLGRKEDALLMGRRAAEADPETREAPGALGNPEFMALFYARTGEDEQAIALIEQLLTKPNGLVLAVLRVSWEWERLRNNPRFQKILASPEPKTIY